MLTIFFTFARWSPQFKHRDRVRAARRQPRREVTARPIAIP